MTIPDLTDRILLEAVFQYGGYAYRVLALRYDLSQILARARRLMREGFLDADGHLVPILTDRGWEAIEKERPANLFRQIVQQCQAARAALAD